MGMVICAGLLPLAIICSLIIGGIILIFVNKKSTDTPYIVVLNMDNDQAETAAMTLLKSQTKKHLIKSKTVSKSGIELTVEVRLLETTAQLVNNLLTIDGVSYATLVSYNGEYTA